MNKSIENKTKKKHFINPVIVLFMVAVLLFILGFVDIKVNAAESDTYVSSTYTVTNHYIKYVYDGNGTETSANISDFGSYTSTSPIYVYYYVSYDYPIATTHDLNAYCISKGQLSENAVSFTYNNETWYLAVSLMSGGIYSDGGGYFEFISSGAEKLYKLNSNYDTENDFITALQNGTLDVKIDYDSLEVDNNMLMPTNIKRNIIKNEIKDNLSATYLGGDMYDYITWTNTSELYSLQLQVVPVVQYYDVRFSENIFTKEFYGEWETQAIYDDVINSYTLCTFSSNPEILREYPDYASGVTFKGECDEKYSKGILEENYLKFGYRVRYIDKENLKASPWLVLVPMKELDKYEVYVEYADNSKSDTTDGNGLFNEYENLEDIENAKTDIKTENDFKDKYDVVDNEVDVKEATNWLYSVVNFIGDTPHLIAVVLLFLPSPILYGLYVIVFIGVIASGIAIVRALI